MFFKKNQNKTKQYSIFLFVSLLTGSAISLFRPAEKHSNKCFVLGFFLIIISAFKYNVNKRGKTPTDGKKDHKAWLG